MSEAVLSWAGRLGVQGWFPPPGYVVEWDAEGESAIGQSPKSRGGGVRFSVVPTSFPMNTARGQVFRGWRNRVFARRVIGTNSISISVAEEVCLMRRIGLNRV